MKLARRTRGLLAFLAMAVVLAAGLVAPRGMALADDAEPDAEAAEVAAQADDTTGTYPLYWYALIPGMTADSGGNPNNTWYGLGVSEVTGVQAPGSYTANTPLTSYTILTDAANVIKELYPDITYTDGVTYKYAAPGSGHENEQGYYTLTPMRLVTSDGANEGNNGYNPKVNSGTYTFHYDNIITLNEKSVYTVNFEVKEPESSSWTALEGFAQRVKSDTAESSLKVPGTSNVEQTKVVDGITYDFDGWYRDEACTVPADFKGTITSNTVFYGHYVPRLGNLAISKSVSGSAANVAEHFTFELSCASLAGKIYDVTITDTADAADHATSITFDANGVATLQLSHGETATIAKLPAGASVSVRETNLSGNAKTSSTASVNGGAATEVKAESDAAAATSPVEAKINKGATTTIGFTNTANAQPDTGVSVNVTPMLVLLAMCGACGAVLAVSARRHGDAQKRR